PRKEEERRNDSCLLLFKLLRPHFSLFHSHHWNRDLTRSSFVRSMGKPAHGLGRKIQFNSSVDFPLRVSWARQVSPRAPHRYPNFPRPLRLARPVTIHLTRRSLEATEFKSGVLAHSFIVYSSTPRPMFALFPTSLGFDESPTLGEEQPPRAERVHVV
ncbi:hypothetical protein PFISCL1PPCAC_19246, partial [Pristionchus fissidentatus]